jgi:hypothetical protein
MSDSGERSHYGKLEKDLLKFLNLATPGATLKSRVEMGWVGLHMLRQHCHRYSNVVRGGDGGEGKPRRYTLSMSDLPIMLWENAHHVCGANPTRDQERD